MTNEEPDIETLLLLGLNDTQRAGLRELRNIERAFGSLEALRRPSASLIQSLQKLSRGLVRAIKKKPLEQRGREAWAASQKFNVEFVLYREEAFPAGLKELANPPLVIFYLGHLPRPGQRRIAIVGARMSTRYGLRMAQSLAHDLATRGVEITSGLARGIDRAAHEGVLEAGGVTHGVLGCGLPRIYPSEHVDLADAMQNNGSVLCEFSPLVPPLPGHFPRRNRIIAALCDGLVLVEAKEKSGGLITVRWAADLGRQVAVIPGQADNSQAAGCLALARDGVPIIRHAKDLLDEMRWIDDAPHEGEPKEVSGPTLTAAEARLLATLDHEPVALDQILPALDQTPGQVLTSLLALELRGLVEQEEGMRFRKV